MSEFFKEMLVLPNLFIFYKFADFNVNCLFCNFALKIDKKYTL